jgi:hypothetical protein
MTPTQPFRPRSATVEALWSSRKNNPDIATQLVVKKFEQFSENQMPRHEPTETQRHDIFY